MHVVFGKVITGMDVVHKIVETETDDNNKPIQACVIADSGSLPLHEHLNIGKNNDEIWMLVRILKSFRTL